jgi:membrane dipeptidase
MRRVSRTALSAGSLSLNDFCPKGADVRQFGGSLSVEAKGGLTGKVRALVRMMEKRGMIVDLAHASPQLVDDVLAIATRSVVVSHTGARGKCNH